MIDTDTAARIAADHGLTLGDAASLRVLADTEAEARHLARRFSDRPEPAEATG